MKKLLSIMLSILMVVTMIPMAAYAAADTGPYAPTIAPDGVSEDNNIFANGTPITIEAAGSGTAVWYMDGGTKKYVNPNGANGDDLSGYNVYAGSNNADGMKCNGSITMTGGTIDTIYAGQSYGGFRGTSTITVTGGTILDKIFCNSHYASSRNDYVTTVTIFDSTGATIDPGDGKADNVVQKKGSNWNVSGNGIIPEGITVSVSEGETLTVPSGATLTNNGALVNNGGTIKVYGKLLGKAPENYSAPTDFSFNTETLKANVSTALQEAVCTTSNTTLLPWFTYEIVDKGTTEATLSGRTITPYNSGTVKIKVTMQDGYCEPISKTFDFPVSFTKVTSISGTVPTEAWVNMNVTLPTMAVTPEDASYKTVVWTVANANGTGATINGSTLKATNAGAATIRATVENGTAYGTAFTKDYTVAFKESETIDISLGSVTISKKNDTTLIVTYSGFSGGSKDYMVGEPILITGTSADKVVHIKDNTTASVILENVTINNTDGANPFIVFPGAVVSLTLVGDSHLSSTSLWGGSIGVDSDSALTISGDGTLTTTSSGRGAALGSSYEESGGTIVIEGGTIVTTNRYRSECALGNGVNGNSTVVTITGGSVKTSGTSVTPTNGSENASQSLSCKTIILNGAGDGVSVSDIDVPEYYSAQGVTTMDGGKIYLWLPADTMPTCITLADGTKYICNRNNTFYTEHNWTNATCFNPKHCSECGITDGDALEHNYKNGICLNCGIGEDGHFYISNVNHLMVFATYVNLGHKNANATLMADIDLAEYTWTPIGVTAMGEGVTNGYTGSFDGNGHVIRNVTFATPASAMAAGIFGTVQYGGTVRNLGVENLSFDDNTYDHRAGGIAGQLLADSTISDCYVSNSTVKASSRVVGGIVGMNYGTVKNCYTCNMSLAGYNRRFGGISGDFSAGKLENCYTDYSALASSQAGTATNCKAGVSADVFASGEIAYLLNGSTSKGYLVWGQLIGTDSYPVFGGETVYYNESKGYYNILHTCDFSGEWKYDADKHWKECTVDGCDKISEDADHSYTDGKCDCGYECAHENETGDICSVCGATIKFATITGVSISIDGVIYTSDNTSAENPAVINPDSVVTVTVTGENFDLLPAAPENAMIGFTYFGNNIQWLYNNPSEFDIDTVNNTVSFPANYDVLSKATTASELTYTNDDWYTDIGSGVYVIYIDKKDIADTLITLDNTEFIYSGNPIEPTVLVMADGQVLMADEHYTLTFESNVNAGTASVTVKGIGDYTGEVTKDFTITKAYYNLTAPTPDTLIYDGENQYLVSAGTVEGADFEYSLDGVSWSTSIPQAKDVGNYTVYYRVLADENHYGIEGTVDVTIKECPHEWNDGVLTRPVYDAVLGSKDGYYTYTCTLCGEEKTETVKSADYSAYEAVSEEINALLQSDELTNAAKQAIYSAANECGHLSNDLTESEQNIVDDLVAELEKIVADAEEKIASGEYVKADYTEIDEAIKAVEEKLADENVTDEGKAGLEEIKAQLEEMKADGNTSEADLTELEKELEDYEAELDKGIEDGTLVKVDGDKLAVESNKKFAEKLEAEGLLDEYKDFKDNQKATDEALAAIREVNVLLYSLEGTVAENAENIAKINEMMDHVFTSWENCLRGTHNFKDYEITSHAKCEVNAKETSTCWFCGETDEREIPGTALIHSFTKYEEVTAPKCGVAGKEAAICDNGCGATDEKEIPALSHKDADGDYKCDYGCGHEFEKPAEPEDPSANCDHLCHSNNWFVKNIIWKIVRFFWKLFKMNPVCECGAAHY